jgi:hypothetical protein
MPSSQPNSAIRSALLQRLHLRGAPGQAHDHFGGRVKQHIDQRAHARLAFRQRRARPGLRGTGPHWMTNKSGEVMAGDHRCQAARRSRLRSKRSCEEWE